MQSGSIAVASTNATGDQGQPNRRVVIGSEANCDRLIRRTVGDLYRAHRGTVYRFARHMLGNDADADEVTTSVFLRIFEMLTREAATSRESSRGSRFEKSYLLQAARNCSMDVIQRRRTENIGLPELPSLDPSPYEVSASNDTSWVLQSALRRLPKKQQEVVVEFMEDRDPPEIAYRLYISVNTVGRHLQLARENLRPYLARLGR